MDVSHQDSFFLTLLNLKKVKRIKKNLVKNKRCWNFCLLDDEKKYMFPDIIFAQNGLL